jgi:uncharacterized protein DUF2877
MRLVRVGEGVAGLLAEHDVGRVVAVFSRAVYLSLSRGLLALVDVDAEPGPLHAHVTGLPAVAVGDPVHTAGGRLYVAGRPTEGSPAVWRPRPLPDPGRVAGVAPVLRSVLDHEPDLDLAGGPGPAAEAALCATLRGAGLAAAATVLAGRGRGLTPAGDDVLAGLLLVARMRSGRYADTRLVTLARQARTHDISRAFLAEAALGRSLAAVHDLVGACADGNAPAARRARERLAGVGHTSGLDLAYGVLVGSATAQTRRR